MTEEDNVHGMLGVANLIVVDLLLLLEEAVEIFTALSSAGIVALSLKLGLYDDMTELLVIDVVD